MIDPETETMRDFYAKSTKTFDQRSACSVVFSSSFFTQLNKSKFELHL